MARFLSYPLGTLTATGPGPEVDVSHLEEIAVCGAGPYVATVDVEVSFDGTNYAPHSTHKNLTDPFVLPLDVPAKTIRLNVTSYTSGTITGGVGGRDTD